MVNLRLSLLFFLSLQLILQFPSTALQATVVYSFNCKNLNLLLYILLRGDRLVLKVTFQFWISDLYPEEEEDFKSSESTVSENNYVYPENIVLMYSKVFFNSKFEFLRKSQNKSVCVRTFLRCTCIKSVGQLNYE